MSGSKTTFDLIDDLKLSNVEGSINMSNRNVATSRVADLLGVGNLVAKSENVTISDNNGRDFSGNMMESARPGKSGIDIGSELKSGRSESEVDKASKGEGYQIGIGTTGGFQRDLCNLQILDCICGQLDRHAGNYIISRDENGDLAGLQGIDNDASFGLNEDNKFTSTDTIRHNRSVVDSGTGGMILPFVDDNMAKRIESLDPSALEYVLKELLTKDEIKACIARFNNIKQAIRKTRKEEPERFLKNENDWNDDTAQTMIDDAWKLHGMYGGELRKDKSLSLLDRKNASLNKESYFGRLVKDTFLPNDKGGYTSGLGASPKIRRRSK